MKNYCLIILLFLSATLTGYSQDPQLKSITAVNYTKSLNITFNGGNNGGFGGSYCEDVCVTHNIVDGWMDVVVHLTHIPRQVLNYFMGNCWTDKIIFDQSNRYIEFRVKSDIPEIVPMSVNTWGGCVECCPEVKTWPGNTFTIPEANKWFVVLLKVPPTTGGSQNVIDTVGTFFAWALESGNYTFDYIKLGIAAIPPKPTINAVKDIEVFYNETYFLPLTGIKIPDRLLDGLKIKAETKHGDSIIRHLSFQDILGTGPLMINEKTNIASAALQITPDSGAVGMSDSIFITLTDTIRNTTKTVAFKVSVKNNVNGSAAPPSSDEIMIYPNPTTGIVTIEMPDIFTGDINILDMVGNIVKSQKVIESAAAKLDLSTVASGIYIIKISDGKEVNIKKVVKQ